MMIWCIVIRGGAETHYNKPYCSQKESNQTVLYYRHTIYNYSRLVTIVNVKIYYTELLHCFYNIIQSWINYNIICFICKHRHVLLINIRVALINVYFFKVSWPSYVISITFSVKILSWKLTTINEHPLWR